MVRFSDAGLTSVLPLATEPGIDAPRIPPHSSRTRRLGLHPCSSSGAVASGGSADRPPLARRRHPACRRSSGASAHIAGRPLLAFVRAWPRACRPRGVAFITKEKPRPALVLG